MVQRMRTAASIVAALIVAAPAAAQSWQGVAWQGAASGSLSPDEVAWHVRAGLNVAALACRDADAATMVAQYNNLLAADRAALATARAGVEADYRVRFGASWQARDDDDMTRLYNHFATPESHAAFCATARALLRDSETVAPAEFYAFARYALPRLEQAFAPAPDFVDAPRYTLAARDDMPRPALATNARVPLAPDGREALSAAPTVEAQPGFQDER